MIFIYFIFVLISCLWIMKACDPFEDSANYLGRNMTAGIKGATINAVASSIPEFLSAFIFLFFFHDQAGFGSAIGTTAGSAVFNAMVIPSMCIFTVLVFLKNGAKFNLSKGVILRDGFFLIIAELVLISILAGGREGKVILSSFHALVLIAVYIVYAFFMFIQHKMKKGISEELEDDSFDGEDETNSSSWFVNFVRFDYKNMLRRNKEFTTSTAFVSLFFAIAHLSLACYLMVFSVVEIANYFNMNTFFVAVIVAAAATSVPDTVISIRDAISGNYDDSVSNAVGSNIFDISICLGVPLLAYTLFYNQSVELVSGAHIQSLRIILLFLSLLVIFLLVLPRLGLLTASVLFSGYIFYAAYSWCSGMSPPVEWTVVITDNVLSLGKVFSIW